MNKRTEEEGLGGVEGGGGGGGILYSGRECIRGGSGVSVYWGPGNNECMSVRQYNI